MALGVGPYRETKKKGLVIRPFRCLPLSEDLLGSECRSGKNVEDFAAWHDADRSMTMCQSYWNYGAFVEIHLKVAYQIARLLNQIAVAR